MLAAATLLLSLACSTSHGRAEDGGALDASTTRDASPVTEDAWGADASESVDAFVPVDAGPPCAHDGECDDGLYCTGSEVCRPGLDGADARGCLVHLWPCSPGFGCNEHIDACTGPCEGASDGDGDGHASHECGGDDCNDRVATIHPGGTEVCDGQNQDCDGFVDEGTGEHHHFDSDGDGWGDARHDYGRACPRAGLVDRGGDCDDTDPAVHPGATGVCDHRDTDCDGALEPGEDDDLDGYLGPLCSWGDDCDDHDAEVYPTARDVCFDGRDNNCDGFQIEDPDGDGVLSPYCGGGDCDDGDASLGARDADGDGASECGQDCDDAASSVHPGAPDRCDAIDQDCDYHVDDADGDGSSPLAATCDPTLPGSYPRDDCDDAEPWRHGGSIELCDGIDDDCDSATPDTDALCLPGHACVAGGCRQAVAIGADDGTTCAILDDASVRCFGTFDRPDLRSHASRWMPLEVDGVRARSLSRGTGLEWVVTPTGAIVGWDAAGALRPIPDLPPARAVATGWTGLFSVHEDGTTRMNGAIVAGAENADELDVGDGYACIRRGGAVLCWGANEQGQLGDGTRVSRTDPRPVLGIDDAIQIAVSSRNACAVRASGATWCWGTNDERYLRTTDPSPIVTAPSPVDVPHATLVSGDGTIMCVAGPSGVHCWGWGAGPGFSGPGVHAPNGIALPVRALAVLHHHACAIDADRAVRCWGAGPGRGAPPSAPRGLAAITAAGL